MLIASRLRFRAFSTSIRALNSVVDLEGHVISLLRTVSPPTVPPAAVKYKEFADRSKRWLLPQVPDLDESVVNKYVFELTNYSYAPETFSTVKDQLLAIVESVPDLISKQSFVDIVQYFHFNMDDSTANEVITQMERTTSFQLDIDFHNVLLAFTATKTVYQPRIDRLQQIQTQGLSANANTWYYLYRALRTGSKRLELLDLMPEYGISQKPVFFSAAHELSKRSTHEQLLDFYAQNGYTLQNINSYLLNRLAATFLNERNVMGAFELVKRIHFDNSIPATVNMGTYSTFNKHFLAENQVYNSIAFCNEFQYVFRKKFSHIMALDIINGYLSSCTYFEKWPQLTRYLVNILVNNTTQKNFLLPRHFKVLANYARLHGLDEFKCRKVEVEDLAFGQKLINTLRWENHRLCPELEENNTSFIEMANQITPHQPQDQLDPSQILRKIH
ncbi:hypothetical protein OGAPHI_003362 [Ogataea philodendri]|uniref:Uncharacterized protein n=1 Tax=Ogataea philodendri TaxID=1378263 RepID=A0A9P8P8S7_9ASCO|nr:uncharacterized protein OGAPHI_003362 [Ogataea philodendri]KAH3666912.1 hypothetical protein OGAPHI_003362 [Ogataea philodendri]